MQINLVSNVSPYSLFLKVSAELDKDRILRHLDKILIEQVDEPIIEELRIHEVLPPVVPVNRYKMVQDFIEIIKLDADQQINTFVESYSFNKDDLFEVLDTYSKDTELDALGDLWDFILMLIDYVPMSLDEYEMVHEYVADKQDKSPKIKTLTLDSKIKNYTIKGQYYFN